MGYTEHVEWAKEEFHSLEKKKHQIILELARRLEKEGMPAHLISEFISEKLEGYISKRYVRDVLKEEKYKDKTQVREQSTSESRKEIPPMTITNEGKNVPVRLSENDVIERKSESEESAVENKLEDIGVDLKQERIDELEGALQDMSKTVETLKKEKNELADVVKKSSFKTANDPDNLNEDYDSKIAIPMLITKLRGKMGSGWHFVENRMRYIS